MGFPLSIMVFLSLLQLSESSNENPDCCFFHRCSCFQSVLAYDMYRFFDSGVGAGALPILFFSITISKPWTFYHQIS